MKTNKTNKSIKKYNRIVDLTNAETYGDVYDAFVDAKVAAGEPITEQELIRVKGNVIDLMFNEVAGLLDDFDKNTKYIEIQDDKLAKKFIKIIENYENKKLPWYKRFWRWITFKK